MADARAHVWMTVDHPEAAGFDLSSLETLVHGASPISEALVERATTLMPTPQLIQFYGMTEMVPVMTALAGVFHRGEGLARGKVRSAGQATFGVEVRIVDPQGAELPRGEVGEIAVLSPAVMLGYWNKPEETASALGRPGREGWMHTGDAGRMDEHGFLFLVDRVKDMTVSGGENVYSVEVEQAVAKHPAVAVCAVIGVPDADWGERVHAVVVLKAGAEATADDLRNHCRTLIACASQFFGFLRDMRGRGAPQYGRSCRSFGNSAVSCRSDRSADMSLYLTRAQYSSSAFKGMVTSPSDRGAAARTLFESMGIKTHTMHYSVSSGEIVTIVEGTAEQMAAVEMIIMSSGAFMGVSSLELVSIDQMNAAMTTAGKMVAKYQAPNR